MLATKATGQHTGVAVTGFAVPASAERTYFFHPPLFRVGPSFTAEFAPRHQVPGAYVISGQRKPSAPVLAPSGCPQLSDYSVDPGI